MLHDFVSAPFELKLAGDGTTGEFSGYGAVFGNQDAHGDVIAPGAFVDSLAERKAQGRSVAMHVMHGFYGGDGLPAGKWNHVEEDSKGLLVSGKLSGMNTDKGRHLYELVKDGALGGLSIGYTVKKNGASYGTKPGDPKRTLKALNLHEISLVDDPSNAQARVTEMKRLARLEAKVSADEVDFDELEAKLAAAIVSGNVDAARDAYEMLTGKRGPDEAAESKASLTIRDVERFVRDEFSLSHSQARAVVERRFKAQPREEGGDQTNPDEQKAAADELLSLLRGYNPAS